MHSRASVALGFKFAATAALALLASAAGCSLPPMNVWVYIDNAGDDPLVVSVDGKESATIAPGEVGKLDYPPGVYRFCIRRGAEVLCDLERKLEKSDRFGMARKYLFNPDKLARYQTFEAKYGGSRLEGVMETGIASFQKDPQIRNRYAYKQLLKVVTLLPADAWNDVTGIDYVLTPPPDHVVSRSGTTRRTVLDRIEQADYERLTAAGKIDQPTKADLDELHELVGEILKKSL